ncbi:uncharacterized protein SPPG_00002 [Spizellomyces punctatus DAOM BR117]|uniref:Multicopper oxidase n=1 Tax=Spizellomyces punctatus (strain DAOM BR117) TaxID=645134 RepID=A0A0L0HSD4_SPIPD|nr:uncharacterized protein SPPG_00002 [Spizellomyces punctatus DAOM BR117]KND04266.1 hypothetical protein SPPG_00002 [Spizellomyces punctatus DAOM BR117]|eukprot:XP_016612305.1 hypothetical protein SPPG_00002 [Spizellomyces punctatus DAOM BR117]
MISLCSYIIVFLAIHVSSLIAIPHGRIRTFRWKITNITDAPDGIPVFAIGINGRTGASTVIDVNLGDLIKVHVTNALDVPTALHWHGILQEGTVDMDGPAMVTQCPIPPAGTYTYTWRATEAGTFWWHGHYRGQLSDGLRGPIIVRGAETFNYDEEYIVFLEDHFYRTSEEEIADYLIPRAVVPLPESGLLNRKGFPHGGLDGVGDPSNLTDFIFQRKKRYLLRIINAAAVVPFEFSIDKHRMTVVQADATDVTNMTVDSIYIDIAQRYSVIVHADQLVDRYWMRARPSTSAKENPVTLPENGLALSPMVPLMAPPKADKTYVFAWDFHADESGRDDSEVTRGWISVNITRPLTRSDGLSYVTPKRPTLFDVVDGKDPDTLPKESVVFTAEPQEVVDIVFMNREFPPHPFHLHGHTVWVLGYGTAKSYAEIPFENFNLTNPLRRDTFSVPSGTWDGLTFGWTVVRFVANNPGVWFLHCHLEFHIIAGLAMTLVEDVAALRRMGISPQSRQLCRSFEEWREKNELGEKLVDATEEGDMLVMQP